MHNPSIFFPVVALAFWTLLVLLLIPIVRVRSAVKREVRPDDFKYGESASVPPRVSLPNRNYMNLLELPMLFYVVCIVLFVTGGANAGLTLLAWAYVVLRIVHSLVHLTYNHVIHRLSVFALSNVALVMLWIAAAMHLIAISAL